MIREGTEILHGPSSSAERLSRFKTRKQIESEKEFLKERNARLDGQQPKALTRVLEGVVVFFEGYTDDVSSLQLTKLIYKNGGKVCNQGASSRITHIVCTNLCSSKAEALLRSSPRAKKALPKVVTPEWVHHSCQQAIRLAEDPYLVLNRKQDMAGIDTFFTHKESDRKRKWGELGALHSEGSAPLTAEPADSHKGTEGMTQAEPKEANRDRESKNAACTHAPSSTHEARRKRKRKTERETPKPSVPQSPTASPRISLDRFSPKNKALLDSLPPAQEVNMHT